MIRYLHLGGLVAIGFDPSGQFMLAISHSGRGVYHVGDWEQVARDTELAYPDAGQGIGIGPIVELRIPVTELNYDSGRLSIATPDGLHRLEYSEGTVTIKTVPTGSDPESHVG